MSESKRKYKYKVKRRDILFNKKTKHPAITWSYKNGIWESYSISHRKDKNHNYVLNKNPNPDDNRKSYMSKYINKDMSKAAGKPFKNYHLDMKDKEYIQKLKK